VDEPQKPEPMSLSLNRISVYMPHRLTDEELEAGFIVRTQVFENICEKLLAEKANSIPQHYLVVGQRGMGKTTFLRRIDLELRKNKIFKHLIPLSFPEEQYNIDRFSKFWLNCLDALADTLETEGQKKLADEIDDTVKKLSAIAEESELAEKAHLFLKELTDRIKRRPVLLVDNLNQILDRQKDNEHWQLRNLVTKPGAPILIGASAEPLKENYDYKAPFYDSFEVFFLEKLSFEELQFLLRSLAEKTGQNQLINQLSSHTARIRTLYALTGGNPRTAIILFHVFVHGFSETVYQDLDSLLEAVTPLYKARFEELSQQLQVVVDAIALHWDPCQLDDIREMTRLENQQLSPQLKRLKEMGWINQVEAYGGRGTAYEIGERFFNVWYLMRRSSRRQKRELLCLTKFLELLYGEDIDKVAGAYLKDGAKDLQHVTYGLALAEATKDNELSERLRTRALDNLMEQDVPYETMKQFEIPEKYKKTKKEEFYKKILSGFKGQDLSQAIDCIKKWKKIYAKDFFPWFAEGYINNRFLKDYIASERAYRRSLELNGNYLHTWNNLGNLLADRFQKFEEAEIFYKNAIELDGNYRNAWNNLGKLYKDHLQKYTEAEIAYKKAIELDENNIHSWNSIGLLYAYNLKEYEKAEMAYKRALELGRDYVYTWNNLGNLYTYGLKEYEKAEMAYKKAIALDGMKAGYWYNLGNLYSLRLEESMKAEKAYKKAIELDGGDAEYWYSLGRLYQFNLIKYRDAEKAYKNAIKLNKHFERAWLFLGSLYQFNLQDYTEAENTYKNAIELGLAGLKVFLLLGQLQDSNLKKYDEAEKSYLKGMEINKEDIGLLNRLGNLQLDHLGKYAEAEENFKKAIDQEPNDIMAKYNLLFLLRDKLVDIERALKLWRELRIINHNECKDTKHLHEAIFAYYDKNAGIAAQNWKQALEIIGESLPENTFDDWKRSAAMAVKLGYGKHLLEILEETGHDKTIRPFYEAIKALDLGTERYLLSVAAEVREPAKLVFQFMKKYAGIETKDDAPRKKK
jgi:tetratricopeptide (TPR) repeat protein